MRTMSRRQFMRWEKLRLRGRQYVIARTAAIAAISLFIGMNLIWWLATGNPLSSAMIFLYPALGIVIGMIVWTVNENRFEEFLANKKANSVANQKRKKR